MILIKCGIDPGRYKIGIAFAEGDRLLFSAIIPKSSEDILYNSLKEKNWEALDQWKKEGNTKCLEGLELEKICLGNGTSSEEISSRLEGTCDLEITDEYGTTLKGREMYWKLHPPKGFWKLVPRSLRTPPRDIDDLAAWMIIK
ncbi:MAG: endonuclease [Synergistaceae bacterium]|nr:endonuclease [Synergistaceae bacterium]